MFIGHFGLGLAAKPAARNTSLGTLFLASQFIDLLWSSLLLLGLESVKIAPGISKLTPLDFTHYPISHSMLAVGVWSFLFGAIYYIIRRAILPSFVCGSLVASHWILDVLTHRPDLPLSLSSSIKIGLGLWNFPLLSVSIELLIFAAGLLLYLRTTKSNDRVGSIGLWFLVALLVFIYIGNVLGPPPPSVRAIAWAGQAQWLLVALGYWVDKHRKISRR